MSARNLLWYLLLHYSSAFEFDVDKAIHYNEKESHKVYFPLPTDCVRDWKAERWTGLTAEPQLRCISKGHGMAKVLLIGNSYGYRTFPTLHKLFAGNFKEFRLFTKSSRMFLNKDPLDNVTINFAALAQILIEKSKPDIVFVIEKDMEVAQNVPFSGNIESDPIFNFTQARVKFLSEHCRNVVIDDQFFKPNLTNGVASTIATRLRKGRTSLDDYEDLKIEREEYLDEFKYGIKRFDALKSPNLVKNRVQEQLCHDEFCYFFNHKNLHAYYGDLALHQTTEMIKKLKAGYRRIIKHFLREFEMKSDTESATSS